MYCSAAQRLSSVVLTFCNSPYTLSNMKMESLSPRRVVELALGKAISLAENGRDLLLLLMRSDQQGKTVRSFSDSPQKSRGEDES